MNLAREATSSGEHYAIVGMGLTGLSCARFLRAKGHRVSLLDSRSAPPNLLKVETEFNDCELSTGEIPLEVLQSADYLIVSPGVSLRTQVIQQAVESGTRLTSDIDLFRAAVAGKVACITGSNGKSTVATLLSLIAEEAGVKTSLCGNIGTAVLDTVEQASELYVVELSSFQLERCGSLRADVSVVLNVSADHMDRYVSVAEYRQAKAHIHNGSNHCLLNRDEENSVVSTQKVSYFTAGESAQSGYGINQFEGEYFLTCDGEPILPVDDIALCGRHNQLNALVAIALADALGIDRSSSCKVLKGFPGLPHRCETVAVIDEVTYINDSKGTNPGATLAALHGLGQASVQNIVLIAGGVGKDADFTVLTDAAQKYVRQLVVFGQDAADILGAVNVDTAGISAESLEDAVRLARQAAKPGDFILFSPACASFDMFENFAHRGAMFKSVVSGLQQAEQQGMKQ